MSSFDPNLLNVMLFTVQFILCICCIIFLCLTIHKVVYHQMSLLMQTLLIVIGVGSSIHLVLILIASTFLTYTRDLSLFNALYPFRRNIYNLLLICIFALYLLTFGTYVCYKKCTRAGIACCALLAVQIALAISFLIQTWFISAIALVVVFHISMILLLSLYICCVNQMITSRQAGYEPPEDECYNQASIIEHLIHCIWLGTIVVIFNFVNTTLLIVLELRFNDLQSDKLEHEWMYHLNGTISGFDTLIILCCVYYAFGGPQTGKLSEGNLCDWCSIKENENQERMENDEQRKRYISITRHEEDQTIEREYSASSMDPV